ncbi:MAG: alpha/beta hydrolase [Anaerolineales bacterium]|nr:alpha/beta hydrolase [Anaerolineales bacterium]
MKNKKPSRFFRFLLAVLGLLGLAVLAFIVWGSTPARPMPEVFERVPGLNDLGANERWLTFVPDGGAPTVGLILYPGGRVDFRAYAPAAQAIADRGYFVAMVRMPLNLAVFDPDAAAEVIAAHPEIERWAVGGHSLGGAMAANFAAANPGSVQGLVLWAAYPAASDDLSRSGLRVVSISASLDGLATPDKIAASRPFLPPDTVWVVIEGGNHAQFGWYGIQKGDNFATISREMQQVQVIEATVALLESLK